MKHSLSKFSGWCAVRFLAVVLLSVSVLSAQAQSVTYFGANNDARACHEGAQRSARTHLVDTEALHRCTIALNHGRLKARNRAATYVNRGILRAGLGQYRAAMGDYQSAENLYPAFTEILVNRGNVFF